MKYLAIFILGYFVHISMIELANLSWTYRFTNCVVKMHRNEVPKVTPSGRHYCLNHMSKPTLFESFANASPEIWKWYDTNIGEHKLTKAYKESLKGGNP